MDLIEMARDLGRAMQQDKRYIRYNLAQAANDEDAALQELIGAFNLKRMALSKETANSEKAPERIKEIGAEMQSLYERIMACPNMAEYAAAEEDFNALTSHISAIIAGAAQGDDPAAIEPSCGGGCSGCSGCG